MIFGKKEYSRITIADNNSSWVSDRVSSNQISPTLSTSPVLTTVFSYIPCYTLSILMLGMSQPLCSDASESDVDLATVRGMSERKRKQAARDSPPSGVPVLKRQNSMPDVHSQTAKFTPAKRGPYKKKATTPKSKTKMSSSIEGMSPLISQLVRPWSSLRFKEL